jgi:F-type H+-transporting ATPase subunit gamma
MSLEQTTQHKQAVSAIHDIVSAMRAIAAGRIQSAQKALGNARRYQEVIMCALASLPPESRSALPQAGEHGQTMLLVLTSEQPFCGAFNHEVLELAERRWHELSQTGPMRLVAVGQRGERLMNARGIVADESVPATTSLPGLRDLVRRLANLVDKRYEAGQVGELRVIYNRYRSVSEQIPAEEKLLPFDWSQIASGAATENVEVDHYLSLPELQAGLVSEFVFISLYRIAAESFASEQASRLVAMDGATRNTDKMLKSITELERRQRQEQITRQVLELIAARFATG